MVMKGTPADCRSSPAALGSFIALMGVRKHEESHCGIISVVRPRGVEALRRSTRMEGAAMIRYLHLVLRDGQ
jgi:hypothetical protein